ncbi:MAG: SUF system NifU family Fe-S cluster assembly protein, partial [Acidimicrobiaceae bacterium]|nr:SUF system NifU family Fe-S cluster assembly protein [Acidimicrobiaceae bacterium]
MAGLEDLYKEIIIDHYRSPRNSGELETPPAKHAEGFNPLCGDEVQVYVQIDDGVIIDVAIGGQGCSISQASASMMSAAIKGKTLEQVDELIVKVKSMMGIHEDSLEDDDSGVLPEL